MNIEDERLSSKYRESYCHTIEGDLNFDGKTYRDLRYIATELYTCVSNINHGVAPSGNPYHCRDLLKKIFNLTGYDTVQIVK